MPDTLSGSRLLLEQEPSFQPKRGSQRDTRGGVQNKPPSFIPGIVASQLSNQFTKKHRFCPRKCGEFR